MQPAAPRRLVRCSGLSVATILKATQPVKTNKHIVHLSTLKGTDEDEEALHIAIEDPERTGESSVRCCRRQG